MGSQRQFLLAPGWEVLFCFCPSWAAPRLFPREASSLASATLSTTSSEGTTKARGHHHDRLNAQDPSSRQGSSSNSSSNSLSNSSSPSPSSSSSSNSSSSSPSLQGLLEGQVCAEQQHQTTFGRIQGTTFSEGMWQHGRLAAPHSSSTRPRLTASRWAWSRSPSTAPPSRTTSTD